MLFNSTLFLFAFLPATWVIYQLLIASAEHRLSRAWLVCTSLFFYGYWDFGYVFLILASIAGNHGVARLLHARPARLWLVLGIIGNLALLGYYKYANFFLDQINELTGTTYWIEGLVLPIGISFFTFQQIAYLVDLYRGQAEPADFLNYALFVSFFPQLIAGPIVHHREMMPQFERTTRFSETQQNLAVGLTIFAIGLFKKVVIADSFALAATPVFDRAATAAEIGLFEAWGGALAYTLQLYFDFSGYTDMALGLGRMFGIRLPPNFNSPYQATSIIEFWRRWHMTLSRFLRDYLYIPLGGNRHGPVRRHVNLMIVMLLGGLWHGAGWTFVVWGGLHGLFLIANHAWAGLVERGRVPALPRAAALVLTLIAVVFAWVVFRASSLDAATVVWAGMLGLGGIELPAQIVAVLGRLSGGALIGLSVLSPADPLTFYLNWLGIVGLGAICLFLPNSLEIMRTVDAATRGQLPSCVPRFSRFWQSWAAPALTGLILFVAVSRIHAAAESEFLYYQF